MAAASAAMRMGFMELSPDNRPQRGVINAARQLALNPLRSRHWQLLEGCEKSCGEVSRPRNFLRR
jgi:hypothetical protein